MAARPKALPVKALEALARKHGVSAKGTRREIIRRLGKKVEPTFDDRNYLGSAPAPPSGSFLEDTASAAGGEGNLETEHTGEKGATWKTSAEVVVSGGTFNGKEGLGGTSYRYAYASGLPASPDYSVEAGLVYKASSPVLTGPALRISTEADTSYQWGWETKTGFSLLKRIAGVETVLATWAHVGEAGETGAAIIQATGTSLKAFYKGVERASATDSAISATGRAGFRMQGRPVSAVGAVIDYIVATDTAKVVEGAASLTGTGSLSAGGRRTTLGRASLSGLGSLGSGGTRSTFGVAALSGVGSLSAGSVRTAFGVASLKGVGELGAGGLTKRFGAATLSGAGALVASGSRKAFGVAKLSGLGSLAAAGVRIEALGSGLYVFLKGAWHLVAK